MTTPELLLRSARRILLTTHIAPDGDAIGGLLGLGKALRQAGKRVTVSCSDPVPSRFAYLPGYADIVSQADGPFDLVVTLDCGDLKRAGRIYRTDEWRDIPLLNIDHHVTNTHFGTHHWVDASYVATSEMVLELCDRLGLPLDADIATCLLYGIIGDTLALRTDNVTPALLGKVMLSTLRLQEGVVWVVLSQQARHEVGWPDTDLQGLANFLLSVEEANLSAVLAEKDDGQVEVSLRARPSFDVSAVAVALGGGGHPQASGCTMDGPLDTVVERVVAALKSQIPNIQYPISK
ncbi:MAG: putative Bifunctional oligoribonuclease and phosphatase NrnA [Chloroflexi bacterium]|nr:putative Bifunctional oligoribonuclease and phosphatase NrnA [Chloroflexota bacterium]